ncbi:MAG: lytic murein transglycosylase [Pseudomonadota bacterium]
MPVVRVSVDSGFSRWVRDFRSRALRQGISPTTFDRAFSGVSYNADIISRDRNQAEFSKALWEYLDTAVSDTRIKNGRAALRKHRRVLDQIEARYGVEKEVVVAVWGLESAYGAYRGNTPIIEALATLAYDGRRGKFFESQLIAALKIIQAGDVAPRSMTGSWAGAIGHTQFIPTSYLAYAVDFTGDGKRDIWSDNPTDALASTAAYLSRFGWTKGQPWGVEVQLPRGFNYAKTGHRVKLPVRNWTALGVRGMDGRPVPNHGEAAILIPAGANGPAFMIFKNFNVIERYNAADSYVIAVGHLSNRIVGGDDFQRPWPRSERALRFSERKELQQRLTAAGFSTQGVDGKIGPNTIAAIRQYQSSVGMAPDGFATRALLDRLR